MHALIYWLTRDSEQRDLVMDRLQYAVQATVRDEQLGGGVGEDCLLREPGQHCTLGRLLKQPGLGRVRAAAVAGRPYLAHYRAPGLPARYCCT